VQSLNIISGKKGVKKTSLTDVKTKMEGMGGCTQSL